MKTIKRRFLDSNLNVVNSAFSGELSLSENETVEDAFHSLLIDFNDKIVLKNSTSFIISFVCIEISYMQIYISDNN